MIIIMIIIVIEIRRHIIRIIVIMIYNNDICLDLDLQIPPKNGRVLK